MNNLVDLFKKYKEQIMYLIFGVVTTLVCWGVSYLLEVCFNITGWKASAIAEPIAMVVAYITNKIWVFESKCNNFKELIKEMFSFFSARIITILMSMGMNFIFIDTLGFPNMMFKMIISVIVVILNYVFSKLFIFKGNK